MVTIFEIICSNPDDLVRQMASQIFTIAVQNNLEVQNIVSKLGAINLIHQFKRETNPKNKEALMSCISAFLRGENFEGKREFLKEFEGLNFLIGVFKDGEFLS